MTKLLCTLLVVTTVGLTACGKDENNPTCTEEGYYECATGECIEEAWLCDGEDDCSNGEDEYGC